jgi:Family of unknown function (DUF695)
MLGIWPFKRRPTQSDGLNDDRWAVAQGTYEGQPVIVRLNKGAKSLIGRPDYSFRVGIAVPFQQPDERGFPPQSEMKALDKIEDAVDRALEERGEAVHVATITTAGMREFVFYTGNTETVLTKINRLRTSTTSHEIQSMSVADPEWTMYKELAF